MTDQPPAMPAQKRFGVIAAQVGGAILLVIGSMVAESNLQIITSNKTPDDVFAKQDTILERLRHIENRLKPSAVRPDPWTGSDAARESGRLRDELNDLHATLKRIDASLDQLTEFAVSHELEHAREEFRDRRRPPTPPHLNPKAD